MRPVMSKYDITFIIIVGATLSFVVSSTLLSIIIRQYIKRRKRKVKLKPKTRIPKTLPHRSIPLQDATLQSGSTGTSPKKLHDKIVIKQAKRKRSSTNIDEEHKYTEIRVGKPTWYTKNDTAMILPLQSNPKKHIDLKTFPGKCRVYINGKYSWTSNVVDSMSAQSLWRTAQKRGGVSIEPETTVHL